MRKAFIYALCEPDSRTVRYIGKTGNLARRFQEHITKSSKKRNHLGCWLRGVLGAGKIPNLVVLCETSEDLGSQEEIWYISAARAIGVRLTNATDGGEGITMTLETRAKIGAASSVAQRGRKQSEETIAKRVAKTTGKKRSLEARAKMSAAMRGRKFSLEHRAKLSAALRGRKCSAEARANMGAASRGHKRLLGYKHSAEARANMSAGLRGNKNALGHKPSAETRAKTSAGLRGNKNTLGYKHSAETRAKMSAAHREPSPETREKMSAAQKARHLREREIKA